MPILCILLSKKNLENREWVILGPHILIAIRFPKTMKIYKTKNDMKYMGLDVPYFNKLQSTPAN